MKWIGIVMLCALGGCNTTSTAHVLDNLQGCERHYEGIISAGVLTPSTLSGTVKIDCAPKAVPPQP